MKNLILILIFSVCALCSQNKRANASERYQLRWRQTAWHQFTPKYIDPEWKLWLYDNLAHKTLWKVTLDYSFDPKRDVFWSKNHKAVAVSHTWEYLVWREGYRLRDFRAPDDYMMGLAWSPDNRRLLARSDGSGAADIGCGGLYCLELGVWPRYKYFRLDVACEFRWISNNKVMFTQLDDYAMQKNGFTSQVTDTFYWRVPSSSIFLRSTRQRAKRRRRR